MRVLRFCLTALLVFLLILRPSALTQINANAQVGCASWLSAYCEQYEQAVNGIVQNTTPQVNNNIAAVAIAAALTPNVTNLGLGALNDPTTLSVLGAAFCQQTNSCPANLSNLSNLLDPSLASVVPQLVGSLQQLGLGQGTQQLIQQIIGQFSTPQLASVGGVVVSALMSHIGLNTLGVNVNGILPLSNIQSFLSGLQSQFGFAVPSLSPEQLLSSLFNASGLSVFPLPLNPGNLVQGLPTQLTSYLQNINVPLSQFATLSQVATSLTPALVDIPFASQAQQVGFTVVSGGTPNDQFQPEACYGRSCRQVELLPSGGLLGGERYLAWIHGDEQRVLGGKPAMPDEPTGQKPYPPEVPFKNVIKDIREKEGEVEFALYFQFRFRLPNGMVIATPHQFGPLPVFGPFAFFVPPVAKEGKDTVLIQRNFASAPSLPAF